MSLHARYTDAYRVARTINGIGQAVKVIGFALGAVIAFLGAASAKTLGPTALVAGMISGALTALAAFVLGVLVSTQGQILSATIDTAVNSSPLLSPDEIRRIVTGSSSVSSVSPASPEGQGTSEAAVPAGAVRLCTACGRRHSPNTEQCDCGRMLKWDRLVDGDS